MGFLQEFVYNARLRLFKARRSPRLVPKIVTVHNEDGTVFQKRVWVLPEEAKKEDQFSMVQPDLFNDIEGGDEQEPAIPVAKKEEERKPEKKPEEPAQKHEALMRPIAKTKFSDYGSWSANGKHLTPAQREKINNEVADLVLKRRDTISEEDKEKIRRYSGFGGIQADEKGVLYDFYTSPPVARAVWQVLNKLKPIEQGASVLEPACGTGVFFETAPEGLDCTGVEIDQRTAAVASILQPEAKISATSFEVFNLHNQKKFDYVIGNAPFGDRSVDTSFIDLPEEKSLDRYFMTRSIDNLREGGALAMIVHPGVLENKGSAEWRASILRKAQFMGAIKLPDKSFKHTQTSVQPVILLFRKYPEVVANMLALLSDEEMKQAGFWHDEWVNGTYRKNILGELKEGAGNWNSDIVQGELTPEILDKAVANIEIEPEKTVDDLEKLKGIAAGKELPPQPKARPIIALTENEAEAVAAKTLTVGMTKSENGKLYRLNENHRWELMPSIDEITAEKMTKVNAIAKIIQSIRRAMQNNEPVDDLQMQARELIQGYQKEYGTIPADDKDVQRALRAHASVSGIYEGLTGIDADILTKANIYEKDIETVNGHNPAVEALMTLQTNMAEGSVENIYRYFPDRAEALLEEMNRNDDIFLTPEGIYQLREDFIAGEVYDKIDALEKAIQEHEGERWENERKKWQHGIDEIRKAVRWTSIEDAEIMPQSSWVPDDIVNEWVHAKDGMNALNGYGEDYEVKRNEQGRWGGVATRTRQVYNNRTQEVDTTNAGEWYEVSNEVMYFLNGQKQRSKNVDTATYNKNALENFKNYIASHEDIRQRLETLYNKTFNNYIAAPTKTYAVKIDGWNDEEKQLKPWQWQTVHHLYRQGKGISALGTGFGKTLAAIALMGLLRQEGKAHRIMVQVPQNKVKDWVNNIKEVMPKLKVRGVDPEDKASYRNQESRYKLYQDIANSDCDVIVLPESAASEIQLKPEHDEAITREFVEDQIVEAAKSARKQELAKEKAKAKLTNGKTNKTITFEDFGVDALFVDEAHNYKNLFMSSLSRETGMNDGRRSDRAMSLFKKSQYLQKQTNGKNVFFLTATPLTNSPLEYYNMLMHVAPEELKRLNLHTIDDFITNFADIEQGLKYYWGSGDVKEGKIVKGFRNIQALQNIFFKYTDFQNDPKAIGLVKPSSTNVPNLIPAQKDQAAVIKGIAEEIEAFQNMDAGARAAAYSGQNFLTFYSRMRTASLDLELYDPQKYKGWKNPKLEKLAENAYNSYKATGGGQVIFCDRVLSGDKSFNLHEKIKKRLVEQGFNESEIAIVNGLTQSGGEMSESALEEATSEAIKGFNKGKYKVIIGTTQTLGEGVNLQKNSAALHHFDIPYRPSDFIQRNGRVDRQGNQQKEVALHTYMAAGTIDNYSVSLVQSKANWIDQLLKTKSNIFLNPDDGSYIDADELLLALTQEFGGESEVAKRRQALEAKRAEAFKQANAEKVDSMLAAYSMMRSSLRHFTGDKGSLSYQNRVRKMREIEDSLRANQEFKYTDILDEDAPEFIYSKVNHDVYRVGDIVIIDMYKGVNACQILGVDHKKQAVKLHVLNGDDNGADFWKDLPKEEARKYMGNGEWDNAEHIARPNENDIKAAKSLDDPWKFIQQDESFKRKYYPMMLKNLSRRVSSMEFITEFDDGRLIPSGAMSSIDNGMINPYDPEGKKKILSAIEHPDDIGSRAIDILRNPIYEDAFGEELRRAAKEVYEHSKEKKIIEEEAKNGWVNIHDMVQRHPELKDSQYSVIPALLVYAGKYNIQRDVFSLKREEMYKSMLNGYHLVIRCGKIQGRRKE